MTLLHTFNTHINYTSYDDLIVGAPMNTDYDALSVERGSIYVFLNDGVSIMYMYM